MNDLVQIGLGNFVVDAFGGIEQETMGTILQVGLLGWFMGSLGGIGLEMYLALRPRFSESVTGTLIVVVASAGFGVAQSLLLVALDKAGGIVGFSIWLIAAMFLGMVLYTGIIETRKTV